MEGKIKFYNLKRGFGFIVTETGEYFFHATALADGYIPQPEDLISFEKGENKRGICAVNISKI